MFISAALMQYFLVYTPAPIPEVMLDTPALDSKIPQYFSNVPEDSYILDCAYNGMAATMLINNELQCTISGLPSPKNFVFHYYAGELFKNKRTHFIIIKEKGKFTSQGTWEQYGWTGDGIMQILKETSEQIEIKLKAWN